MRSIFHVWEGGQSMPPEVLQQIEELCAECQVKQALVDNDTVPEDHVRKSRVDFLPDRGWLKDLLYDYALEANRRAFGLDVTKSGSIQYTEYHGDEEGHYAWHTDENLFHDKPFDRKISMTIQLSDPDDYEGGDFEIENVKSKNDALRLKGTVLVFPSVIRHRVTPVTKGIRKSLVAWFEGPRWR